MSTTTDLQSHDSPDVTGKEHAVTISSWLIVLWTCYIFLGSLPYKFSSHPDTQHIFSTIGDWMKGFLGVPIGDFFSNYGAYVVGSVELLTSILLLSPIIYWLLNRSKGDTSVRRFRAMIHAVGGIVASAVMAGAVFFHLFTPLGIAVLHKGVSDGGSLFRAAASILILGIVLFLMNWKRGFPPEGRS